MDNRPIFVAVVSGELEVRSVVRGLNSSADICPSGAAILADLPLVGRAGAVGCHREHCRYFRTLCYIGRIGTDARGETLAYWRSRFGPSAGDAHLIYTGSGA